MAEPPNTPTADLAVARTAIEASVRVGLVMLLAYWCFSIAQPFLVPIVWGMIIAIAVHPAYLRLCRRVGGRHGLAAVAFILIALLVLIGPLTVLTRALVDNVSVIARELAAGGLIIPPPPAWVAGLPVIGTSVEHFWQLALSNLGQALAEIGPQLRAAGTWLLGLVAGAGFGLLNFIVAIVIAGVFLAHTDGAERVAESVAFRLAGERGPQLVLVAERTVRAVARGIIGTALIQSTLAGLGFVVADVPGAAFLTLICFLLCVVQIGPSIILLGAVIYVFSTAPTATAVLFLVWSVLVGLSDNVLKPLLMSKGGDVPLAVIFIGAIGGLLAHGLIGLFVGPIVFALGYRLFWTWVFGPDEHAAGTAAVPPHAALSA